MLNRSSRILVSLKRSSLGLSTPKFINFLNLKAKIEMAQRVEKVNLQKRKIASSPKKGSKGLCITFQCNLRNCLKK